MEDISSNNSDNDEEFTTNQIKLKAQEIAKRIEKYHGRYTSSSRCNTPLPITSAESIESIHSNSVISDTSDKILLFRQFLENDRKLVENSQTDVPKSNNDDPVNDENLLDEQNKKGKINEKYYEDIISAQFHETNVQSLKSQIVELNEKLENYHNNITEKDMLLQLKTDKIESLNKAILQNNKLHLETLESLKKRNIEVVNEERARCTQKINRIEEESVELNNNLEDLHRLCDKLKKKNIKIDKENTELRKREMNLQSEIEELSRSYENEKKFFRKLSNESSKHRNEDMENELLNLQQENDLLSNQVDILSNQVDLLSNQVALLESKSMNYQENNNLLMELDKKETEFQRLNLENEKLNNQLENQIADVQQKENRWIQLKDAYLKDKERMTLLENGIAELQRNEIELNDVNVKLTEQIEKSVENVNFLKADNEKHQEQISVLTAVIENMHETFEKAMKESSNEYELNKKHFIQQHEDDQVIITTCNNKLKDSTTLVDELTYKLNIVLKENNSFKCERLEFNDCLSKRDTEIFKLNNAITEFHTLSTQLTNELDLVKKDNIILKDKLNGTNIAMEDNKLLSDRFQKQKQLLKVKVKALKESENNCLLLQQQVFSLNKEINVLNQRLGYLIQSNKQISTVVQNCDVELQKCYELLNNIVVKSNLQNQNFHKLHCVFMGLVSLFSFENFQVVVNVELLEVIDSICNNVFLDDNELRISLKKMVLGSIQILEYIVHLKDTQNSSKAQLIELTEVEKFVSEAVEKVKLSTQNEYLKQKNELLKLIENLQNDNHSLKLNISTSTFEDKEVLTDLIGPTVNNLLSLENVDIKFIKNENDTLKQFLKNIREDLGLININEKDDGELLNTLSALELHVQEIKNENKQLKNQFTEHQRLISLDILEQPIQHQADKYSNLNTANEFIQPIEHFEENDESKEKGPIEEVCLKQLPNSGISNSTENSDSKILLVRYKNLKSRFKDCRAKTIDLEKKICNLTNDLECANSKYNQLNDQYGNSNETHEADIIHCQSEIENLMCEKLEAYRQLTTLKEKHEILQNDYDQLKSNLVDKNSLNDSDTISIHKNEQTTVLKGKLNETQRLIDSAYSKVLCEWPPIDNDPDWVFVQSKKLDKIVEAKSLDGYSLGESEIKQLQTCVQNIHELVTSILTNTCSNEVSSINVLVDLISDLKSCTETFLELLSVKNNKSTDELHTELSQDGSVQDSNSFFSSEKSSINKTLIVNDEAIQSSLLNNGENKQHQRAIAERDRLIEFLSDKISKLDNLSRNVNDIRLVKDKLDRALTAVHERDVRCDELTLELTRLLEERDMLQLKLSNSIRQIQFLSDNQSQLDTSNLLDEKFDLKTMDDKLEELHSLEYRKDAELFTDQEQRHMSQMELHQNRQDNDVTQEVNSVQNAEEANSALSWLKDILW